MQIFDQVLPSPTQSLQHKELMQVFDQRLCLCSNEGTTEKKERLQKETSEPVREKIQKTGARREQKKYSTINIKVVLSSGDSEAEQRERASEELRR